MIAGVIQDTPSESKSTSWLSWIGLGPQSASAKSGRPLSVRDAKPGDVIGFSGHDLSGALINLGSWGLPFWSLSHVGIIAEWNGELLLFESTMMNGMKCRIQGHQVAGVQAHRLEDRVANYNGKVWLYPLWKRLDIWKREALSMFLYKHLGYAYDAMGALRSAGRVISWIEGMLRPECLESIFCSELCCAAHSRIGLFDAENASRWNPNRFVRAERKQGVLLKPHRLK